MSQKYASDNKDSNPLGGSDILIDVFHKRGMVKFFDEHLDQRNARAEYSYGESILTLYTSLCSSGKRTEDVYNLRRFLRRHPKFRKGMSPDTLLYVYKEMSVKSTTPAKENISEKLAKKIQKGKASPTHLVNVNETQNELLIDTAIKLGRLKVGVPYILDYDTTDIKNKIKHSRKYYAGKGKRAYCPGVSMINKIPVYVENRNGDSNPSFNLVSIIERTLELLRRKGIIIKMVRIDSAAYSNEFTNFINSKRLLYVTRARFIAVKKEKEFIRNWAEVTIKGCINRVGDNVFQFGDEESRMIVKKVMDEGKVKHWGIITNDFETASEEMLDIYAKRGDCENLFSGLKAFGWKILPTRNFEANTTYLYLSAICYIMFRFVTRLFANRFPYFKEDMRFKTFFEKFMQVSSWWKRGVLMFSSHRAKLYIGLLKYI